MACYHIVQSFRPGEVSPELALQIAKEFAAEHLDGYEACDRRSCGQGAYPCPHVCSIPSGASDGSKYHSNAQSYYGQIRAISDRLCKEHGLSVIIKGESPKAISYIEWLREQSRKPTFRAMLTADLRRAIEDANDYGHFLSHGT